MWLLIAGALVAASVLAVTLPGGSTKPTAPRSRPTVVGRGLIPTICTKSLPRSWTDRFRGGQVGTDLFLAGIDPRGDVLAVRGRGDAARSLVLIGRDRSAHTLYRAPAATAGGGPVLLDDAISTDGEWAVFKILLGSGLGAPVGINAVNIRTKAVTVVHKVDPLAGPTIGAPIVVDGTVYWAEGRDIVPDHIYAFDLTTGRQHPLDTGTVGDPTALDGGVYWTNGPRIVVHRQGAVPPGFDLRPGQEFGALLADGRTRAWSRPVGPSAELRMWTGAGPVVTVARSRPGYPAKPIALFVPFVVWDNGVAVQVLDIRTGAAAALPPGSYVAPEFAAAGGVLAVELESPGPQGTTFSLSVVDATTLPDLRC